VKNVTSELASATAVPLSVITRICLLVFAMAILLTGCARPQATTIGFNDDGSTVMIKQGSLLILMLDADPEDFIWVVEGMDEHLLELKKTRLVEREETSRYGGHTFREMVFQSKNTGQVRLKLEFTSLSEEHDVSDTFSVRVNIEK
jgi:hypothetical protein